ncbi:hypothetical protein LCGC14_1661980 [marine sediment metagenome]|uniref:Uncharacterized protein n=1 Tax=marine sediment metagenome TaxID=412755 RepID=A0A0F9IG87_9ZZZZ
MGWNDKLGIGPGYSLADLDVQKLEEYPIDSLRWLKNQLKECSNVECGEQLSVVKEILIRKEQN